MLKLKKLIQDLSPPEYSRLEESLVKNKADNFYLLLSSYRSSSRADAEIIDELRLSSNSFYVMKSRLYNKIQEHLTGDVHSKKEEVIKLLHKLPEIAYGSSREMAIALLHKLEKDLLYYDMHQELLIVYSFLKKLHLYSQKYFQYSQLYNKHIAYSLSLEKSEEILGNFNRLLGQYHFSRSPKLLETLLFVRGEILDHLKLNPSRQIELIQNLIDIELVLFCDTPLSQEIRLEEKLRRCDELLEELPGSSPSKALARPLDFLHFEFHLRLKQFKTAQEYFEKLEDGLETLLLQNNLSLCSLYLSSRIQYLQQTDNTKSLCRENKLKLNYDHDDLHALVMIGMHKSMCLFYEGLYKEMAAGLNQLLNQYSFKDLPHIHLEIRLGMAYAYHLIKDYELLDSLLKNLSRKIKTENKEFYRNVLDLIRVLELEVTKNGSKVTEKQRDHFSLFLARNTGPCKVLEPLVFELKKRYD